MDRDAYYYVSEESDEDEQRMFFLYRTLLMLDRLARVSDFRLAVEPLSGKDVISIYRQHRKYRKFIQEDVKEEENGDTHLSPEEFLEQFMTTSGEYYRTAASFHRERSRSFTTFLNGLIEDALSSNRRTKIFSPQDYLSYLTDFPQFQMGNTRGFHCLEPKFVSGKHPWPQQELFLKFVRDPNTSITRDEVVACAVAHFIAMACKSYGMTSFERRIPESLYDTSRQELECLFQLVTEAIAKGQDWRVSLMDFLGLKTSQTPIGSVITALRRLSNSS